MTKVRCVEVITFGGYSGWGTSWSAKFRLESTGARAPLAIGSSDYFTLPCCSGEFNPGSAYYLTLRSAEEIVDKA